MTRPVRGRLLLVAAVGLLVTCGSADALGIGVEVLRDALYEPSFDSTISPTAVLLCAEMNLGGMAALRVRCGYSSYYNWRTSGLVDSSTWTQHDGYRLQVLPLARVSTPFAPLSLEVGVGVGADRQLDRHRYDRPMSWEVYLADTRDIWSLSQTFVGEGALAVSRRFTLALGVERVGFCVGHEISRSYFVDQSTNLTLERSRTETFRVNWASRARTCAGVGLRFRL